MAEHLEAPVVRVDLFEDRATVHRRLNLERPGRHRITLGPLTPLISERALAFVGDAAQVEEVSVRREERRVHEVDDARAAELRQQAQALRERRALRHRELVRARERCTRAVRARDAARAWTPRAFREQPDLTAWLGSLRTLEEAVIDAEVRRARLQAELARDDAELERLEVLLREARRGKLALRGFLTVQVHVEQPGTLVLKYTVPCALWRPVHRAELRGDRLHWEIAAMAWNATGEDWRGIELVCSTARPGGEASPPTLTDDVLTTRRRDKELVIEARDETLAEARVGERAVRADVGVDDGGEPRTFTAPDPVDLPSDGRPLRVLLDRWEDQAQTRWLAFPERASEVVLRSTQRNQGTRPLLAGPVDLFRDDIAVGRTEVGLVGPGEPFHLGWGSHDGLRVVRRRDHELERGRITGRQSHRFEVELKITHTGNEPVRFDVTERLPVSEVKEVSVGRPTTEPALTHGPDQDGFCGWVLTLKPGEVQSLRLTYAVEAPSHVRLPF